MSGHAASACVIDLAAHPALRSRARRVDEAAAPCVAPSLRDEAGNPRIAARIARRRARAMPVTREVRVMRFRPWLPLFRLWRRWRLGLPLSRLWCAPAKLSSPPSFPGGAVWQYQRSPRPAGAHRRRDLSAVTTRRPSRGQALAR
ncbi:hypothetical protein ACO2Q2_04635 [Dyella sp. KRB-257]|uniref:hypothetical protein n=1 Tax=Dyella sp. KRB-257 TaxID=3400915 RepID=UPI003C0C1E35